MTGRTGGRHQGFVPTQHEWSTNIATVGGREGTASFVMRTASSHRKEECAGIENGVELFDEALRRRTGVRVDEQSPIPHAKAIRVATLVAQVHDDALTYTSDGLVLRRSDLRGSVIP